MLGENLQEADSSLEGLVRLQNTPLAAALPLPSRFFLNSASTVNHSSHTAWSGVEVFAALVLLPTRLDPVGSMLTIPQQPPLECTVLSTNAKSVVCGKFCGQSRRVSDFSSAKHPLHP